MSRYDELLGCGNFQIADIAVKCRSVFETHGNAYVGISGGVTPT